MIIGDDPLNFVLCPLPGFRHAQVDGLPLERLWLPVLGNVCHHPVTNFWIPSVECPRSSGQPGLSPIDPKAELQPMLVRVVRDSGQSMGKLFGIGIPVTDAAKPSCVDMKHVNTKVGRIANHARGNLFVHCHAATPTVIRH